jgi:hypothetical protein
MYTFHPGSHFQHAATLDEVQRSAENDAKSSFEAARHKAEHDLQSVRHVCQEAIDFGRTSVAEHQTQALELSEGERVALLDTARQELGEAIAQARERYLRHSWFRRWIWATPEVIADEEVILLLVSRGKQIEVALMDKQAGRPKAFSWLAANGYSKSQVMEWCRQFEVKLLEREAFYRDVVVNVQVKAIDARNQAVATLNKKASEIAAQVKGRLGGPVDRVHKAAAKVRAEQGRLGLA